MHHLAKIAANSVGALTTLLLNGYGPDAMSIARGILEKSMVVAYLIKNPDKLDDYFDFRYIYEKRKMDHYDKRYPELNEARMTSDRRKEIEDNYASVVKRFTGKRGVRYSWSEVSVFKMAGDVEMADHYNVTYADASGIQHGDINGLHAYFSKEGHDVEIAPSERWIRAALYAGHRGLLSLITSYNEVAGHGFDAELDAAKEKFKRIWKA